jgi:hypothetical protein
MTHALLRYGDLTASGIAGGRAGLNVDSAMASATIRSDDSSNAIFAVNELHENGLYGRKDLRNNGRRTWLAFDPTCCPAVVVKWIFEIGKTRTEWVKLHVNWYGSPTS